MEFLVTRAIERKDDLVGAVRDAIAAGVLRLGSQLPTERQLATATGLSRTSVRAALDRLVHEGRLVRHVGRGTFVIDVGVDPSAWTDPTSLSPADILAARALVEPTLPHLIVMAASDAELSALELFARDGREVSDWRDAEFFDSRFHLLLYETTRNVMLREIGRFICRARTGRAWTQVKRQRFEPRRWAEFQDEHEQIAAALAERDRDRAEQSLAAHLSAVRSRLHE